MQGRHSATVSPFPPLYCCKGVSGDDGGFTRETDPIFVAICGDHVLQGFLTKSSTTARFAVVWQISTMFLTKRGKAFLGRKRKFCFLNYGSMKLAITNNRDDET